MPYKDPKSDAARASQRERARKWGRNNPEYHREWRLRTQYGITVAYYDSLLESQGGRCALCGAQEGSPHHPRLAIDHCHDTGAIRGLLCNPCNTAIGKLGDNVAGLERALAYLKNHHSSTQDPCPAKDSPPFITPAQGARVQMELLPEPMGPSSASSAIRTSPPPTPQ